MISKYHIIKSNLIPGIRGKNNTPDLRKIKNTLQFLHEEFGLSRLIGEDPSFMKVVARLLLIAKMDAPVLVLGEVGTEKELFAQAIHYLSQRKDNQFFSVNCSVIPLALIESELFGQIKNKNSDAQAIQKGYLAKAEGGTLFLNELDSIPVTAQSKLLSLLKKKRYKPLNGKQFFSANVRLIASSNINLLHPGTNGYFKKELIDQLREFSIIIPPLRTRKSDIPIFVNSYIDKYSKLYKLPLKRISKAAMLKLMFYHWPGNVRELENVIHQCVLLSSKSTIEPENIIMQSDLDFQDIEENSYRRIKTNLIEKFERDYLAKLLFDCKGDIDRATKISKMSRRNLFRMMKKYNIARKNP